MILYFSGNGNSRLVAETLGKRLSEKVAAMMHLPTELTVFPASETRVIWVMPVHCWGIPVAVATLLRSLAPEYFGRAVSHYLVLTCGDDCGKTADAWRKIIRSKGWTSKTAFSVQMPNTYVLLPCFDVDTSEVASKKLQAMGPRIDVIAERIRTGSGTDDVVEGAFPRAKSAVYPLFARFDINPGKFTVDTQSCIHCGKCMKACPLSNITFNSGSLPHWGNDCTQCLGCYNVCPTHAIAYGHRTKGKGQYYTSA